MNTTGDNKRKFTMDDFEKGLVLLGLLSPSNETEINDITAIEELEKKSSKERQQLHFKRVVLAAEIVSKLYNEPTFGRIEFQKLVYLCEHTANMDLAYRYSKQAAGPFDNKFMHSIHTEFKKLKWFDVQKIKEGNFTRHKYVPLEKADGYLSYYNSYFTSEREKIQYVIDLFRNKKTDETELAATVFACYLELVENDTLSKSSLLTLFYNWSDKKQRFSETQVVNSFYWLIQNSLIPETQLR